MKTLILAIFSFASMAAHADTSFLLQGSDGMNLAKILLRADTQKCLSEKGFDGVDMLTDARKAMIEAKGDTTIYTLTIDQYKILPADGTELDSVKDLTITAKKVITRAGSDFQITCSFAAPSES